VSTPADLAALLMEPVRAAGVPSQDVPALLEALSATEGRCRLLRDLLTRRLYEPQEAATPALGDWLSIADVATTVGCSTRTVRRRMRDGTWREGVVWFAPNGTEPRFSRAALDAWQGTTSASETGAAALGLAFGPDVPPGRRRRSRLQNVA
jgi:hypothetical protein